MMKNLIEKLKIKFKEILEKKKTTGVNNIRIKKEKFNRMSMN